LVLSDFSSPNDSPAAGPRLLLLLLLMHLVVVVLLSLVNRFLPVSSGAHSPLTSTPAAAAPSYASLLLMLLVASINNTSQ
jgi:hypothetical protein